MQYELTWHESIVLALTPKCFQEFLFRPTCDQEYNLVKFLVFSYSDSDRYTAPAEVL